MPFDIRCSSPGCGKTEQLSTDSLLVPAGWSTVIVKTHGCAQAQDEMQRAQLCPECSVGAMDRLLQT